MIKTIKSKSMNQRTNEIIEQVRLATPFWVLPALSDLDA